MDWIDPRYSVSTETSTLASTRSTDKKAKRKVRKEKKGKSGRGRDSSFKPGKPLSTQVDAALAQPLNVWTAAFDHAISGVKWPQGCSTETTFLWSTAMLEQAEVLVRAGMSAKKLSAIVAESTETTEKGKAEQLAEVVGLMDQSLETLAFQWLDSADAYAHAALGVAAIAWHIPEHAKRPAGEWLTQWLQAVSDRIANFTPDADESVLCRLVLQCELPLLIGVATSASKRTVLVEASKAMDNLAECLEHSEDSAAAWLAHGATYLRASLGSVLRCRVLANSLGLRKWYPPQQKALAGLLKHATRWSRPDGTPLLGACNKSPRAKFIWDALIKQTKSSKPLLTAMSVNGLPSRGTTSVKFSKPERLPALTHFDADAAGVVMQCDWLQKGGRIALDYSDTEICLEALGPKGRALLAGEWTCHVAHEGQTQLQLDEWGQSCWFSDEDVDYLELEAKFGKHALVQRQIVLFRAERMLLVADALLCDQEGQWALTSRLPLAGDVAFETDKKTTEGFLVTPSGARCLTIPLFLPEWRRQPSTGSVACEAEDLVIENTCHGKKRMYAPVLISLCGRHAKKPFTWRQLTVGEDLRIVGNDEAVAYRVQTGTDQLLLYRTLAPPLRRTALGMHTLSDFYAGRFDADEGDVDTLVEVEANTGAS